VTAKQWDAGHYNQSFAFIWNYGAGVLELLKPEPGERILDLGCGTGHLTKQIHDAGATVVGIDHSSDMIDAARQSYQEIEFQCIDAASFSFDDPFDAVFSNAVLHWVQPPARAVQRIRESLKPGGRFVAEFGGHGNVAQVVTTLVSELEARGFVDAHKRNPWYFPSIAEYTTLLEGHGLEPIFARLYDRPTLLEGGDEGLAGWLTMFGDSFLAGVPAEEHHSIMQTVADRLRPTLFRDGNWYADYRRLQIIAVKR
jgi:trans-aconitate methyltransferase